MWFSKKSPENLNLLEFDFIKIDGRQLDEDLLLTGLTVHVSAGVSE